MKKARTRWRLVYEGMPLPFVLLVALYFVCHVRILVLVFLLALLSSVTSQAVPWTGSSGGAFIGGTSREILRCPVMIVFALLAAGTLVGLPLDRRGGHRRGGIVREEEPSLRRGISRLP